MEITYGELLLGVNENYRDEILVETSVDTSERGGAERVLSLEAEAKASSVELMEGEAEVSGKVNYRLLYLDKQGRLCGLDYFKDFKCRVKGDAIVPSGRSAVTFCVPDAEARLSGDEVNLSAVVDISLSYYGEENKKAVASVTEAEILSGEIVTQRVTTKERALELDKVAEVGLGVKKIVLFGTEVLPVEVKESAEGLSVCGEVRGTVLYLNDADEVAELTVSLPFCEVGGEAIADYAAIVKSARVILTDDGEGNAVEVEVTLNLTETIYEEVPRTALLASCGEKCRVEESYETLCKTSFLKRRGYSESLSGTVELDESGAEISFVRPGCHAVAEVTVGDGEVKVEGVAAFRVVYRLGEDYRSKQGELPFVYVLPFAEAKTGQTAEVTVKIADAVGSVRGADAAVTAKTFLDVRLYDKKCVRYLADAKEGDLIPESEAGISVYFAEKGEDVWAIAKNMGVLPSALIKANPFLSEPIEEAKKVLIFRRK